MDARSSGLAASDADALSPYTVPRMNPSTTPSASSGSMESTISGQIHARPNREGASPGRGSSMRAVIMKYSSPCMASSITLPHGGATISSPVTVATATR
jgi:hypothetical protein